MFIPIYFVKDMLNYTNKEFDNSPVCDNGVCCFRYEFFCPQLRVIFSSSYGHCCVELDSVTFLIDLFDMKSGNSTKKPTNLFLLQVL